MNNYFASSVNMSCICFLTAAKLAGTLLSKKHTCLTIKLLYTSFKSETNLAWHLMNQASKSITIFEIRMLTTAKHNSTILDATTSSQIINIVENFNHKPIVAIFLI